MQMPALERLLATAALASIIPELPRFSESGGNWADPRRTEGSLARSISKGNRNAPSGFVTELTPQYP
jgi:hypothetical protein